ncbi:MAG: patatin-like phospholipase family protein [Parvularcula sp.]
MTSPSPTKRRYKVGLALGSGAARGWAHVGVLRALDELGVEIDAYAGCSVGALVAGARLLGIEKTFQRWARSIGPVSAFGQFNLSVARGGLINPDRAFSRFRDRDKPIETLGRPFGAAATDLATGKEVWLTAGSTLDACRASSAIPLIFQASRYFANDIEHWLIDGATSNPVPVTLARALGADRVIAVDLNAHAMALSRFDRPTTREVVPVEAPLPANADSFTAPVETFFKQQKQGLTQRLALAKARANAHPQFFETALATMDIIQSQLAQARARADAAEVRITPDLSAASAAAFDRWEYFEEAGYQATIAAKDAIQALAV